MEIYPFVSVIVPVYNGGKTISSCLRSLLELSYPKDKLEIMVVDNNSTDNTKKIIERYPVKYRFEEKRSQSAALNNGIKASKGEIIALTDCDCVVHPDWIKEIVGVFKEDERVGGCGGSIKALNPSTLIEIYTDISMHGVEEMAISGQIYSFPFIPGGNCAYRRNALFEAGLYDEKIIGSEDRDIAIRISLKEYHLKYVETAIVFHKYKNRLKGVWMQRFKYGYGLDLVNKKYSNLIDKKYKRISNELKRFFALLYSALKEFLKTASFKDRYLSLRKFNYFIFHATLRLAFIIGLIWPKPTLRSALHLKDISYQVRYLI